MVSAGTLNRYDMARLLRRGSITQLFPFHIEYIISYSPYSLSRRPYRQPPIVTKGRLRLDNGETSIQGITDWTVATTQVDWLRIDHRHLSKFLNIKTQVFIHFFIFYVYYLSHYFVLNVEKLCVLEKITSRSTGQSKIYIKTYSLSVQFIISAKRGLLTSMELSSPILCTNLIFVLHIINVFCLVVKENLLTMSGMNVVLY